MKQFKMMEIKKNVAEKFMNEMAKEGWDVVSAMLDNWSHMTSYLIIIFSREE